MAIDVNTLAEQAFELAKGLAPQAFRTVTLQLGPTMASYDSATDTRSVDSWAFDSSLVVGLELKAMPYDDEKERKDAPVEARMKVWLFSLDDLTAVTDLQLDATGQITETATGTIWQIYRVEMDPSRSVVQFYTRT